MTRHVILAYGKETELWRATFAILSFYAWYEGDLADVQTVVFTDRPLFFAPYFEGLPVRFSRLTLVRQERMRGPQQYVHRVKVAIVEQVFQEHPNDNLLFCDSDTFFISKADSLLQRLQADVSFMHVREFTLADAVGIYASFKPANQDEQPRKFIKLIESHSFVIDSQEQHFRKTQYIWNSGVLGMHQSIGNLMPDILALSDAFYKSSGWITAEQIAFSLVLPIKTQVQPSNQYVLHYWGQQQKQFMDGLLGDLDNQLRKLPLSKRLATAKGLTIKWAHMIRLHIAREGALYSLAKGQMKAGVKCAAKVLIASPFDKIFTKDLVSAFRRGITD